MALERIDQQLTIHFIIRKILKISGNKNNEVCQIYKDFEKAYDYTKRTLVRYSN